MAQIVTTHSHSKDVILLGANQAVTNRSNAIISEGLDDPANLVELAEYYGVKILC